MSYSRTFLLLLVPMLLGSCIEELEPLEPTFEKVYGFNGSAQPWGISQNTDGSFLIYGWAERTIMDFEDWSRETKDAQMPIIIKVDQHGNEIMTRTFPIEKVLYEFNPQAASGMFDLDMDRGSFRDVVEMSNGKYLAMFQGNNENWLTYGFMILDENLNVEKIQLSEDFEAEFQSPPFASRGASRVFNSPNDNEVLLLSGFSQYLDGSGSVFYSIMRLSLDGTLIDIYDYDMNDQHTIVTDMTIDDQGNAIVVGKIGFFASSIFIHKIDLQTGNILNKAELESDIFAFSGTPKVLSTENGVVLGEVATPDSLYRFNLSTCFLDQDINFLNRVSYPIINETTFSECYLRSFIPMQSGGFSALSFTCDGLMTIYRIDKNGQEIWRWEARTHTNDGLLQGRLIEAADGGVIVLRAKEFNTTGYKMTMIKLDANGKFQ